MEEPPLLPCESLVVNIFRLIHVLNSLKRLLDCLLLKQPIANHSLFLIWDTDVRALDVNAILYLRILLRVLLVGLGARRDKEAKRPIRQLEEVLESINQMANESPCVSLVKLVRQIGVDGKLEVHVDEDRLWCSKKRLLNEVNRSPLFDEEIVVH